MAFRDLTPATSMRSSRLNALFAKEPLLGSLCRPLVEERYELTNTGLFELFECFR